MAKGRFISKTIAFDPRLNDLTQDAREVYLMTIPHLDVNGVITGNPSVLWAMVCPLLDHREQMPSIINELVSAGLVISYDSNGQEALFFKGFPKNQKLRRDREPKSIFNAPPGYIIKENTGIVPLSEQEQDGGESNSYNNHGGGESNSYNNHGGKMSGEVEVYNEVEGEVYNEVEGEVYDEVQAQEPNNQDPSAAGQPQHFPSGLGAVEYQQMLTRLQSEWPVGVGITQIDEHAQLVSTYGIDLWREAFDATKPGARANVNYVGKVIVSLASENDSMNDFDAKWDSAIEIMVG